MLDICLIRRPVLLPLLASQTAFGHPVSGHGNNNNKSKRLILRLPELAQEMKLLKIALSKQAKMMVITAELDP